MSLFRKKKEELPESLSLPPVFPQGNIEDNPSDSEEEEEDEEIQRLKEEVKKLEDEKEKLQQNQKETSKEEPKDELTEERLIAILHNFNERITELEARMNNTEGFLFRHRSI